MTPQDRATLLDVLWVGSILLVQVVWMLWGMVRVTRSDVGGNSFSNIVPLWAATIPVLGWLVARRRHGVVRRTAMRLHAFTCVMTLVDGMVGWLSG